MLVAILGQMTFAYITLKIDVAELLKINRTAVLGADRVRIKI
jgi:hypothetical protein